MDKLVYITERQPWRITLWDQTGKTALAAKRPMLAVQYLQAADEEGQLSISGKVALGKAYYQIGDVGSAEFVWNSLLQPHLPPLDNRTLTEVNQNLLALYQANGDLTAAISTLQRIAQLEPSNAEVSYQLGLLLAAREPETALGYLIRAGELDDNLASAVEILQDNIKNQSIDDPAFNYLNVGRALGYLGEWKLAEQAFQLATEENPTYAVAWAFLGEAQQQLGEDDSGALNTALQLAPDSFEVNTLAALYYQRHGDYEKALGYLNKSAEIEPENPAITAEIANTLAQAGDIEKAMVYYHQAAVYAPKNLTYWYLLSRFSLNNDIQVRTIGIPAARQALLINPNDPIASDLVGYGYYLLGDALTSERFLYRALKADSDYAPAHFHLGMLQYSQGNYSDATVQLHRTIKLAPDTAIANQAQQILDRYFP